MCKFGHDIVERINYVPQALYARLLAAKRIDNKSDLNFYYFTKISVLSSSQQINGTDPSFIM